GPGGRPPPCAPPRRSPAPAGPPGPHPAGRVRLRSRGDAATLEDGPVIPALVRARGSDPADRAEALALAEQVGGEEVENAGLGAVATLLDALLRQGRRGALHLSASVR